MPLWHLSDCVCSVPCFGMRCNCNLMFAYWHSCLHWHACLCFVVTLPSRFKPPASSCITQHPPTSIPASAEAFLCNSRAYTFNFEEHGVSAYIEPYSQCRERSISCIRCSNHPGTTCWHHACVQLDRDGRRSLPHLPALSRAAGTCASRPGVL